MKNLCSACHLPEDGLRVRNVSPRPRGEMLCHDCWVESSERKQAQEEYIIALAEERGITTDVLKTRIITDLATGVPDEQTMTILSNMLAAARRVNESDGYDEFAPDYDALAQHEPVSQIQASREAAGLA